METERLTKIVPPMLDWFYQNARILPWREATWKQERSMSRHMHSYRVWISEIMLQQTRVEAVKPYFARFLEALPDVKALAACEEDRLLKLWEGLGYYNRVRNMQKAAIEIVEKYHGRMPDTYEALVDLPGIGSYTAGAIASITCNQPVPAVDGNVLRVISRICGNQEDITLQSVKRYFESELTKIIPLECPGDFNQALMELGATVCVPNGTPDCMHCPVADNCYAKQWECQNKLPVKAAKKARKIVHKTVMVIRDSEHTVIKRRPEKGLLAGLYELPNLDGELTSEEVLDQMKRFGFSPIRIQQLPEAKHVFSHVEWHMTGYFVLVEDGKPEDDSGLLYVEPVQTEQEYPIPAAFAAYAEYLSIRLGQDRFQEESE